MNDYDRVARVIRYLDAHHTDQPALATLARAAGLSPFHFHRLFTRWAGVTPKDFVQCVTAEHVKTLLRCGENVLAAALDAGLSGPGRLHDLCVSLEAASPGELKSGGRGLRIDFGFADTPFGRCLFGQTPRGICHLSFVDGPDRQAAVADLAAEWPHAELIANESLAARLAAEIFIPPGAARRPAALRAFVGGTAFQVRVWRALLRVPAGRLVSYGQLAAATGQPAAARAVGSAVGDNPISFLIPCHRVIRETGALGGYRWGLLRKRAIIAWEMVTDPNR